MYTKWECLPRDEKALPNAERARIRPVPIAATLSPLKQTEYRFWAVAQKKMLIYCERSQYMYENKENYDRMSEEKSDIYVEVTRILQNFPAFEAQFAGICVFGTGFFAHEAFQIFPIQLCARFH